MDYKPGYGYKVDQGTYFEEDEFIDPREEPEEYKRPYLPRNRKRWDFNTDDISEEAWGTNTFANLRPGKTVMRNPYEVFRRDTNPNANNSNSRTEAMDVVASSYDVTQVMDWTYMKPKINNNGPIFDHRDGENDRSSFNTQTPRVIKPVRNLNSIGGMYTQDYINQLNYRGRNYALQGINKDFITPRVASRPNVLDVEGPQGILQECRNLERISQARNPEIVPEFEPIHNYDHKTKKTGKNNDKTPSPFTMEANVESKPLISIPQTPKIKLNNTNPNEPNLFLNAAYTALVNQPQDPIIKKSPLQKVLKYNSKIDDFYQEVQIDDFGMSPQTAKRYYNDTREIKTYFKDFKPEFDNIEKPFYLNANEKNRSSVFFTYNNDGRYLNIYQDALAPYEYRVPSRRDENSCNAQFNREMDTILTKTTPDYLVQSSGQKVRTNYVDSKPKDENVNIFLPDVNSDEIKRPEITKQTNKVKAQVRSSSNQERPVRVHVKKR